MTPLPPRPKAVEVRILEAYTRNTIDLPGGESRTIGRSLRSIRGEVAQTGGLIDPWGDPQPVDLSDYDGRDPDQTFLRTLFKPIRD